jgi:hypothetical protein
MTHPRQTWTVPPPPDRESLTFTSPVRTSGLLVWFLAGAFVFLYLHLFVSGTVPIWLGGDQTVYLVNATRMLHGEVIYRDFFHFLLPGTELVYFACFKLFGAREWVPNALLIALGMTLATLVFVISKKTLPGFTSFLPALLFLTVAYRNMLNGTHHWFSGTAIMGALALLIEKRTPARIVGAGMLCGVATCFTITQGIVAVFGFGVFLLFEYRQGRSDDRVVKKLVSLFAGFLASVIAVSSYFILRAAPAMFWYSTVTFVLRYYPADKEANSWRAYLAGWPSVPPWQHLPAFASWLLIYALLPLVYLIFLRRYWRPGTLPPGLRNQLMLVSIVGLFLAIGVAPAPNFFRLFAISPPALILFVWLVSQTEYRKLLLGLLWMFGITLAFIEPWPNHLKWHGVLDCPAGKTAFLSQSQYGKYAWLLGQAPPAEFLFDASRLPDLYFPLDLRNPAQVPLLTTTDYTRPEQVQNVVESLDGHKVRLVYWSSNLDCPEDGSGLGDHLGPLRTYLRQHYHIIKVFSDDDQVWARNST